MDTATKFHQQEETMSSRGSHVGACRSLVTGYFSDDSMTHGIETIGPDGVVVISHPLSRIRLVAYHISDKDVDLDN